MTPLSNSLCHKVIDQYGNPMPIASTYNTVPASATAQALTGGGGGAKGDFLAGLLIVPGTTSPGAVTIKDGAGSAITVFTGGATSVADLKPFWVPIGAVSTGGAWSVTTLTNVTVVANGQFT